MIARRRCGPALWIDAASFLVGALLLVGARRLLPRPPSRRAARAGAAACATASLRAQTIRRPGGWSPGGVAIVFFTLVVPIAVVFAKETLGTPASLGYGVMLGGLGRRDRARLGRVRPRPRPLAAPARLASTAAVGVGYGGHRRVADAPGRLPGQRLGGIGNGIQWVAVMTALQDAVGDDYQARAAGLLESIGAAVPGIGFILGGSLTARRLAARWPTPWRRPGVAGHRGGVGAPAGRGPTRVVGVGVAGMDDLARRARRRARPRRQPAAS